MTLKPLIVIFSWALAMEIFSLLYFLTSNTRPVEFYMDIVLIIFTIAFLIFAVRKERKDISNRR
ncbi:hypothetical protein [Marinitoga litoralis]|jgi:hypothetical protein|uniref:TM0026 family membrane protein n=1 Tax=Marinitoga litoralis TaxID=570855 RepID=UPI00195F5968|nr:hypothetical protein [Marinitoga litoralis]MBM7559827.1 hypothetical protein [Marinitoga litoralis]